MLRRILLCPMIFVALLTAESHPEAVEFEQYHDRAIVIRYEAPLKNAAEDLAASYPGIRDDIEKKLARKTDFTPIVVLIRQHALFLKESHSDLVTAFAVPREDLIVMDYSRVGKTPLELRAAFAHELCHLLLHRNIEADLMPKWLDEGIAQWVAGGTDILNIGEGDLLRQAAISGNLLPLDDISSRFPEQPAALSLAYEESRSFVEFIVHEYGVRKLLSILDGLHGKRTVAQAVSENLPIGLSALELNWRAVLLRKCSWQTYLADHLSWLLFFLAAVGTICGYLRLRRRVRNYRDEEDGDIPGGEDTGEDR